jgi:hypothetical protein
MQIQLKVLGAVVTLTGGAAVLALVFLLGRGGASVQAEPGCAVATPAGVVMAVTGNQQSRDLWCQAAEGGAGDLGSQGTWRPTSAPVGQPICIASVNGGSATVAIYDPRATGGGLNDCTILQQDGWPVAFSQQ